MGKSLLHRELFGEKALLALAILFWGLAVGLMSATAIAVAGLNTTVNWIGVLVGLTLTISGILVWRGVSAGAFVGGSIFVARALWILFDPGPHPTYGWLGSIIWFASAAWCFSASRNRGSGPSKP